LERKGENSLGEPRTDETNTSNRMVWPSGNHAGRGKIVTLRLVFPLRGLVEEPKKKVKFEEKIRKGRGENKDPPRVYDRERGIKEKRKPKKRVNFWPRLGGRETQSPIPRKGSVKKSYRKLYKKTLGIKKKTRSLGGRKGAESGGRNNGRNTSPWLRRVDGHSDGIQEKNLDWASCCPGPKSSQCPVVGGRDLFGGTMHSPLVG